MDRRLLMLAPLALTAACDSHMAGTSPLHSAIADMRDRLDTQVGMARIVPRGDHAILILEMRGIAPGTHGLHLHSVGSCAGPDFASAGPHLNPEGHQHGTRNRAGHHMGDLPNVRANSSGLVKATIQINVPSDVMAQALYDPDGTSLVLHAGRDDYRTDPSGNSGGRIACGVFRRE